MKLLKIIGSILLAALAFVAFVYPFDAVPLHFESHAREMTESRIEKSGAEVDASYVDESVRDAMTSNLGTVYRTAFILAAAAALVVFLICVRPPHDCGGINLFNPFALILVALIAVLTSLTVGLLIKGYGGAKADEFTELIKSISALFGDGRLWLVVLIPAALEIVFRGVIFSFLERVHPVAAIVLCPILYAAAVFAMLASYANWAPVTRSAMYCGVCAAFAVGLIMSLITWRLRSGIPAVAAHILIAWSAGRVQGFVDSGSVGFIVSAIVLAVVTAAFLLLPRLFAKKARIFAYDFPFEKHHAKMNDWLYGESKKTRRKAKKSAEADEGEERPLNVPEEGK